MKNANVFNLDQWQSDYTSISAFNITSLGSSKTHVIHDGIDTNWARPRQGISLKLVIIHSTRFELVTFVNRTYEPYRSIHIFIDSLPKVLRDCPTCAYYCWSRYPNVSYGKKREDGQVGYQF